MKIQLLSLAILTLAISCSPKNNQQQEPEVKTPTTNFEKMLEQHGGLDLWNEYQTLEFDIYSSSDTVHHIIDLKTREELASTDDYQVFFGKNELWISPDKEAYGKSEPRFYRNLWFYFFALPFVSADQGVNQTDISQKQMNGNTYDGVKLTFGDQVGDSPEDQYLLWLNAENNQLEWINYSVTYWDQENAEKYSALVYKEWQKAGGLKIPRALAGHKWEADSLGAERYSFIFDNVKFSKEKPSASLFQKPEGAYTEGYQ